MIVVDDYFMIYFVDVIGIGLFGFIGVNFDDLKYGYIIMIFKFGWGDFDFLGYFKSCFNILFYWIIDVNEVVYGELMIGIVKDVFNSIYMMIGIGVGVGVIS